MSDNRTATPGGWQVWGADLFDVLDWPVDGGFFHVSGEQYRYPQAAS